MGILTWTIIILCVLVLTLLVLNKVFKIHDRIFGVAIGSRMPDGGFKLMTFVMFIIDFFHDTNKRLSSMGIKEGDVICDYGCGPGRLTKIASKLVGATGKVYAVDIHPLAKKSINQIIKKHQLKNVEFVLSEEKTVNSLQSGCCDIVFALDMFHHLRDTQSFLKEVRRIIKNDGSFFVDPGHQRDKNLFSEIEKSKHWKLSSKRPIQKSVHSIYKVIPQ